MGRKLKLPEMYPVKSTAVAGISDYDPKTKSFHVKYKNGGVYQFAPSSPVEHANLIVAPSIGKHLNQHFRDRGVRVE